MALTSRYSKANQPDETGPWVMNDMVSSFSSMILIMAIVFLIIMRFDDFTDEYERQLLKVDADRSTQVVYEPEKAVETERLSIEQPLRPPQVNYQGNYGGTITEELSRIEHSPSEQELVRVRLYSNGNLYYQGQQLTAEAVQAIVNTKARRDVVFVEVEVEKETPFDIYSFTKEVLWNQSAADHFRTVLVQ